MPALPEILHRLIRPTHGIHAAHAWEVSTLDDVTPEKADEGKIARVATLEGELSIPTVSFYVLAFVDDSAEGAPVVPYWKRIDNEYADSVEVAAYHGHWRNGSITAVHMTWTDIMGLCTGGGVFVDDVSDQISRSGSAFNFETAGRYYMRMHVNAYQSGKMIQLRARRGDGVTLLTHEAYFAAVGQPPALLSGIFELSAGDVVTIQYVVSNEGGPVQVFGGGSIEGEEWSNLAITFFRLSPGSPGPEGPPGPAGAPGGAVYTHIQGAPAATWNVVHNLGRYAAVTIIDSTGAEVDGEIQHVSPDACNLLFSSAFSGRALCV
jgi:hypothetical protein